MTAKTKAKANPPKRPAVASHAPDYAHRDGRLWVGDCNAVMPRLANAGMAGTVDLFFIDPPFNIGHDYGDGFADRVHEHEYAMFTTAYAHNASRLLRPGGAAFFHLPDALVAGGYAAARRAGLDPVNWIILHQEFGQYGESRFVTSKVHLLYFVKPGGARTWNVREVLEPSLRLRSDDARTRTAKFKGMRPMFDVWYGEHLGRVQGNNGERWGAGKRPRGVDKKLSAKASAFTHPNQLPEMYVARIARCASNPGDVVFDPCCGSGTTWVVADALGRRFAGCELLDYVAESAHARVKFRGAVRPVAGPLANGRDKVAEFFDVPPTGLAAGNA